MLSSREVLAIIAFCLPRPSSIRCHKVRIPFRCRSRSSPEALLSLEYWKIFRNQLNNYLWCHYFIVSKIVPRSHAKCKFEPQAAISHKTWDVHCQALPLDRQLPSFLLTGVGCPLNFSRFIEAPKLVPWSYSPVFGVSSSYWTPFGSKLGACPSGPLWSPPMIRPF